MRLSNNERNVVRRAITSHADWAAYRARKHIDASKLSSTDQILECCTDLNIDVNAILARGDFSRPMVKPAPVRLPTQHSTDKPKATSDVDADKVLGDLSKLLARGGAMDEDAIRAIALEVAQEVTRKALDPVEVEVLVYDRNDQTTRVSTDKTHFKFPDLARATACRDLEGSRLNVLLVGPAGTGKTSAARQLASLMKLDFYFQSQASEAFELVGFVDANGRYHDTAFVKAFRDGGVWLADEVDAWEARALLALNAALSVGRVTLPTGDQITRHADFIAVGGANTFGMGSSDGYSARGVLDLSTLSRFSVRIEWPVDEAFELELLKSATTEPAALAFLTEVQIMRGVFDAAGLLALADFRTAASGVALLAQGCDLDAVRAMTYAAPLDKDQREQVRRAFNAAISGRNDVNQILAL